MAALPASRVYDVYGRFYDGLGGVFRRRVARAIGALPFHSGDRVLDVGIGTGFSLAYYPDYVHVTGIDLSEGMLRQARLKVERGEVRAGCPRDDTRLMRGDAMALPFADRSFDVVFLSHVITTVPDPERCLREAVRVAGEHGYLVLVNHFRSAHAPLSWLESAVDPICRRLGWQCDLPLEELLRSAGVDNAREVRRMSEGGVLFKTVFLRKSHEAVRVERIPAGGIPALGPA